MSELRHGLSVSIGASSVTVLRNDDVIRTINGARPGGLPEAEVREELRQRAAASEASIAAERQRLGKQVYGRRGRVATIMAGPAE